jgi:hypothetical protein
MAKKKTAKKKTTKKKTVKKTGKEKKCRFRQGSGMKGGQKAAKIVAETLQQITSRHRGELRPADVVKEAKRRQSPLHPYFEWDNTKAAQQYRLEQARDLIRSVEVVIVDHTPDGPKEVTVHRKFPNLQEGGRRGTSPYRDMNAVMENEDMTEMLVQRALEDLEIFKARYQHLKQLKGVITEIDRAAKAAERRRRRKKKA